MTTDCGDPVALPTQETKPMQDAMQRTAPAAASMPEALAYTWKQPDTSLQLTACEAGCDKPKDATGHKPCTPSVLAEDDNGLSTSSQDPDTLVGQDDSADEAGAEAKKPAKAGMAMIPPPFANGAPWPWPVPPPWCAMGPAAEFMPAFPMPYGPLVPGVLPPGASKVVPAPFFPHPAMPTPPVFLPHGMPSEWSVMSTVDLKLPSAPIAAGIGSGAVSPTTAKSSGPFVLVAKRLTDSDVTYGRIILPRVAVEANLKFVLGFRSHNLPVEDIDNKPWEFVIKSWANGNEKRRVYALEQASGYLRSHKLAVKDCIGLCLQANGRVRVEHNTPAVVAATRRNGATSLTLPDVQLSFLQDSTKCMPLVTGGPVGTCTRSTGCTKAAGHPGFCSGPRDGAPSTSGTSLSTLSKRPRPTRTASESLDRATDATVYRPVAVKEGGGRGAAAKLADSLLGLDSGMDARWTPLAQSLLGPSMGKSASQGQTRATRKSGEDSMAAALLLSLHTAPSCEDESEGEEAPVAQWEPGDWFPRTKIARRSVAGSARQEYGVPKETPATDTVTRELPSAVAMEA